MPYNKRYTQAEKKLAKCPHCGGAARLVLEGKHFTKRYGTKVVYARIVCENNSPFNNLTLEHRCLCKTVAAPITEVIAHWEMRNTK